MPEFINGPVIAALAVVVAIIMVAGLYARNYIKVPPNMVAVFSGRGEGALVRNGGRFRVPVIERVDTMLLEPFNVEIQIARAYSSNNVPVSVEAVALIRFGTEEAVLRTAIERFLTAPRSEMEHQAKEILAGNLRGVIANMTVEELNTSREELAAQVMGEAADSFGRIGMELDVLTIQNIADEEGYLHALGRQRIAEVKRDAEIGEANAKRDSMVASATARREGETADAEADTAVAKANRARDLEVARIRGEVAAENARAEQAGLLADAEAKKAVGVAEEDAAAARQEAAVNVERQRTLRAREAQKADTIVPAEAAREAADLNAEAARVMTVTEAAAKAQATRDTGAAEAEARSALAAALEAELLAQAAGREADLRAEAVGEREMLLARADGEDRLAQALNTYTPEAIQLSLVPQLIRELAAITAAAAAPVGEIDNITIIGGGGEDGGADGAIQSLARTVPIGLATVGHVTDALTQVTGMDVRTLLTRVTEGLDPASAERLATDVVRGGSAVEVDDSVAGDPDVTD